MAGRLDITVYKGALFKLDMQLIDEDTNTPIDITGATGSFSILSKDGNTAIVSGSVNITEAIAGKVTLRLSASQTSSIPIPTKNSDPFYRSDDYIYHFDIVRNGESDPERFAHGIVAIQR